MSTDNFRTYLLAQGITSERYVQRMLNLLKNYVHWLETKYITIAETEYSHLMDFVGELQKQEKSVFHINRTLQVISHYYEYNELPNIAQTTRIKGVPRGLPQDLLEEKTLDRIYEMFEAAPGKKRHYAHSDKLILGLIIYQALDMQEFLNIELQDLQLEKGKIYVREGRQKRSRIIALRGVQVLKLHTFVEQIRPGLLKNESDKLFAPQADEYNLLHWQFKQLSKKVKAQALEKLDIKIHKISQLRHSRIAIWTKEEGLRKAQYLAGFRRVSSAERYQQAHLEDLKAQIRLHHPLG